MAVANAGIGSITLPAWLRSRLQPSLPPSLSAPHPHQPKHQPNIDSSPNRRKTSVRRRQAPQIISHLLLHLLPPGPPPVDPHLPKSPENKTLPERERGALAEHGM